MARTIDRVDVAARLATGESPNSIARAMGADPGHMRDIAADPEVQRMVDEHRREVANRVRGALVTGATAGVNTLIEAARGEDVPWGVRVQAASKLVEAAVGKSVVVDSGPPPVAEIGESPADTVRAALQTIEARAAERGDGPAGEIEAAADDVTGVTPERVDSDPEPE